MLYFVIYICVQIIGESIPVSSSGHLALLHDLATLAGYHIPPVTTTVWFNHLLHVPTIVMIVCFFHDVGGDGAFSCTILSVAKKYLYD